MYSFSIQHEQIVYEYSQRNILYKILIVLIYFASLKYKEYKVKRVTIKSSLLIAYSKVRAPLLVYLEKYLDIKQTENRQANLNKK